MQLPSVHWQVARTGTRPGTQSGERPGCSILPHQHQGVYGQLLY